MYTLARQRGKGRLLPRRDKVARGHEEGGEEEGGQTERPQAKATAKVIAKVIISQGAW